jgi:putative membrane protein
VAGARLLTFFDVPGGLAGASVMVDLLIQTVTQFFFTMVGMAVLVSIGGAEGIVRWVAIGLAVMAPALAGFFAVQRFGGVKLVETILARLARDPHWTALGSLEALNAALKRLYARPRRLSAAFALHLSIWFFGVFEVWIALRFMGHPVHYSSALVIESLGQAVRGAAFVVPGAIGVQEGGFVALCAVFGIPAPAAVALSLVKRFPEVALGLPGLLLWQALESRNLLRRKGVAEGPQGSGK